MLRIYYLEIDSYETTVLIDRFWHVISSNRREKIKRFKFDDDKKRSLLAEIIVYYAMYIDLSIEKQSICFRKNLYGKPSLVNQDYHFNISHSGRFVVCAVSDKCVGLDIEKYGNHGSILLNHFHHIEKKECRRMERAKMNSHAYNLWSSKESYVKYLGLGLSCKLDSFYIKTDKTKTVNIYSMSHQKLDIKIEQLFIDCNYACFVCYEAEKVSLLKEVSEEDIELLKWILM
ncbi:4'-phosphopantetheinyl transferase superfamily protein [uncultured Vagococcus sp.]|uniref:4'-phosphopantetheinyl transferase family protein n=1 Tax=uncultured Vagococcus sp. TaxID=189676 RepID=UPI0028D7F5B2|nr:4'-phosphopantetheinyl transferase superfamily protein [uncultured Vagococcus sp.]